MTALPVASIDQILDLYYSFADKSGQFNLTQLRKIASKKSAIKHVHKFLPKDGACAAKTYGLVDSYCHNDFEEKLEFFTKHKLEIKMCAKTLLAVHEQIDTLNDEVCLCDFLAKTDILSYVDFLKIV